MPEKQKTNVEGTCLGFYMKHLTQYPKYMGHIDFENMFQAVPKADFEAVLKESAESALRLEDANKAYDKLKEELKRASKNAMLIEYHNATEQYKKAHKDMLNNCIPKEKVRKVLDERINYLYKMRFSDEDKVHNAIIIDLKNIKKQLLGEK